MKINRNMSAVITNTQLLRTENKLTASMERLSSGYKINKAGDSPAGIAISSKMKAQIDALDQAESNASDAESALNIADGALNEVSSMLQRMRELSVQAANGTNSYSDRQSIQAEIDKLTEEIDRISSDTEYNEKTLLDGSSDVRVYSKKVERMSVSENVLPSDNNYTLVVTQAAAQATYSLPVALANAMPDGTITINDVTLTYTSGTNFFEQLRDTAEEAGCVVTEKDGNYLIKSKEYGSNAGLTMEFDAKITDYLGLDSTADNVEKVEDTGGCRVLLSGLDAKVKIDKTADSAFSETPTATYSSDGLRIKVTDAGGFSMDFRIKESVNNEMDLTDPDSSTINIQVTDIGAMTVQIGANQYQEMNIRIPEISSESLYLDTVDVSVQGGADKALVTLDDAIAKLSEVRSRIGAYTNRLEYATNSLAETQEDMTSAYSNIMDTDMAAEMTEYTQQTVLEQAAISVLSQANDLPQQVLSLLQ